MKSDHWRAERHFEHIYYNISLELADIEWNWAYRTWVLPPNPQCETSAHSQPPSPLLPSFIISQISFINVPFLGVAYSANTHSPLSDLKRVMEIFCIPSNTVNMWNKQPLGADLSLISWSDSLPRWMRTYWFQTQGYKDKKGFFVISALVPFLVDLKHHLALYVLIIQSI